MSAAEIPLLRESPAFAARLLRAARRFAEPRYFYHRRVNWSYRYGDDFYAREASSFVASAEAYLDGRAALEPSLADVYAKRLPMRQVAVLLVKVLAHRLFRALGAGAVRSIRRAGATIYRKCYVDDIELVYDTDEPGVMRAVYPFPISAPRQLRYLRFLRRRGLPFLLDGNPYAAGDVLRFVARRDVRSLMRMETRAQIRQARAVVALGFRRVELSDEFDIGSLDFVRALARAPVEVVNCAHGVGKYLPVHAYPEFHVLTRRQEQYYHATRACRYVLRRLIDASGEPARASARAPRPERAPLRVVFLGQTFSGPGNDVIGSNETELLALLSERFATEPGVELYYKPHPNRKSPRPVPGFTIVQRLDGLNAGERTLFASFFSTCQIDPAFKGRKVLVRGRLIHPEIAFDEAEPILTFEGLAELVAKLAGSAAAADRPGASHERDAGELEGRAAHG
jgi:hypothetical protein